MSGKMNDLEILQRAIVGKPFTKYVMVKEKVTCECDLSCQCDIEYDDYDHECEPEHQENCGYSAAQYEPVEHNEISIMFIGDSFDPKLVVMSPYLFNIWNFTMFNGLPVELDKNAPPNTLMIVGGTIGVLQHRMNIATSNLAAEMNKAIFGENI